MLKTSYNRLLLILLFSFALISCGGGSGSSGGSNQDSNNVSFSLSSEPDGIEASYQGKRTPAELTTQLSLKLLETIYTASLGETTDLDVDVSSSRPTNSQTLSRGVNETKSGVLSGSYTISGNINANTGYLTAIWTNYSDQVGFVTNGKVTYDIVAIDQSNKIVKIIITLVDFNTSSPDYDLTSNGNIFVKEDYTSYEGITVFDVNIYEENTDTWYAYDNLKIIESLELFYSEMSGRFYNGDVGYIDIVTIEELSICESCQNSRPARGSIKFIGANQSQTVFNFTENLGYPNGHFEVLTTNQNLTEPESTTYNWRKMKSWKNDNTPPTLEVSVGTTYYPMNTLFYLDAIAYSSDQDGDVVEMTYTWYVNNVEIVNEYIGPRSQIVNFEPDSLQYYYFKAGDTVKLKVSANDGFYPEQEVSTTVTFPEIYNVPPVLVLEDGIQSYFTSDYFYSPSYIANTGTLDASQTYDADGDTLEFKWLNSSNDQDVIIQNPNSAKTNVSCGLTYGCKNICFDLEVTENKNGEMIDIYSKKICFNEELESE